MTLRTFSRVSQTLILINTVIPGLALSAGALGQSYEVLHSSTPRLPASVALPGGANPRAGLIQAPDGNF